MTKIIHNAILGTALIAIAAVPAFAAPAGTIVKDTAMVETTSMTLATSPLQRRNKTLKGDVSVVKVDGRTVLRFSEDFRASNGPDLKIFLSPRAVADVTGKTATQGALKLGFLETNKGAHDVVLPAGVDIADYESVLIHCEQFSVLWGGADI